MADRLARRVAVITGAGSGIGRASARLFAAEGATVVVNDIDQERARQTVDLILEAGGQAIPHPADVTQPDQVEELITRAKSQLGRLDILFANAGGAVPQPTDTMTALEYRRLMSLNADSVFFTTRQALPIMIEQQNGCILMTTSGAGLGAVRHLAVYGMAKAAIIALARSIAADYGHHGIRTNAISPGPMATPAFLAWLAGVENGRERFQAQVPLGRLGTAEDIARTALFLASDDAAFINGVTIPVDGGLDAIYAAPQVDTGPTPT